MEGLVDVSFDGGDSWENLVVLNDETVEGGTSSLERANSTEVFEIDNPRGEPSNSAGESSMPATTGGGQSTMCE